MNSKREFITVLVDVDIIVFKVLVNFKITQLKNTNSLISYLIGRASRPILY